MALKQVKTTIYQPVGVPIDYSWQITSNPNGCVTIDPSSNLTGTAIAPAEISILVDFDVNTCITATATCTLTESDPITSGVCETVININIADQIDTYLPCDGSNNVFCYFNSYVEGPAASKTYLLNMTGMADGDYYIDIVNYHDQYASTYFPSLTYMVPVKYILRQNGQTLVETPYIARPGTIYYTESNAESGFWYNDILGTYSSPFIYSAGLNPGIVNSFLPQNFSIAPCTGLQPCNEGCSTINMNDCNPPNPFTGDITGFCYENGGRINYTFDNNDGLILELEVIPYYQDNPSQEYGYSLIKPYCISDPCCVADDIEIVGPYSTENGNSCYTATAAEGNVYLNSSSGTNINGEEFCIECDPFADVMFVIDISGSLNGGNNTYRQDIVALINLLGIDDTPDISDQILGGAVMFKDDIIGTPKPLGSTLSTISYYINNEGVGIVTGMTCPLTALEYAKDQLLLPTPGRTAPKIIIFITDGIMTACGYTSVINKLAEINSAGIELIGIRVNNGSNSNLQCNPALGLAACTFNCSMMCYPLFEADHLIPVSTDSFTTLLPSINAQVMSLMGISNYITYECEPGCTSIYQLACTECVTTPPVLNITEGSCTGDGEIILVTDCEPDATIEWEYNDGGGWVSNGTTMPNWVNEYQYRAKCTKPECDSNYSNSVTAYLTGCEIELKSINTTNSSLYFSDLIINSIPQGATLNDWTLFIVNLDDNPSVDCSYIDETILTVDPVAILNYLAGNNNCNTPIDPADYPNSNVYNIEYDVNFNIVSPTFIPLSAGNYRVYLACVKDVNCNCCYTDIEVTCANCTDVDDSFASTGILAGEYSQIYSFCIPCGNGCFKIKFDAGGVVPDIITIATSEDFNPGSILFTEDTNFRTNWYTVNINDSLTNLDYQDYVEPCDGERLLFIKIESEYDIGTITTWEINNECCDCIQECPNVNQVFPCVYDIIANATDYSFFMKSLSTIFSEIGYINNPDICQGCISDCFTIFPGASVQNSVVTNICRDSTLQYLLSCTSTSCVNMLYMSPTCTATGASLAIPSVGSIFVEIADNINGIVILSFSDAAFATDLYNSLLDIKDTYNPIQCVAPTNLVNRLSLALASNNSCLQDPIVSASLFNKSINYNGDYSGFDVEYIDNNPEYKVKISFNQSLNSEMCGNVLSESIASEMQGGIYKSIKIGSSKFTRYNESIITARYFEFGIPSRECPTYYTCNLYVIDSNDKNSFILSIINNINNYPECANYDLVFDGVPPNKYLVIQYGSTYNNIGEVETAITNAGYDTTYIVHPNAVRYDGGTTCFEIP